MLTMVNQDIKAIIFRYFRGKLEEGEHEDLLNWLKDRENSLYFESVKQEWEKQPELDQLGARNLDRLNYRLKTATEKHQKPLMLKWWFQASAVAALLLIGLLLGNIFQFLIQKKNSFSEQLVFETPRGQKSLVRLPDGSEVWLNAKSKLTYTTFTENHRGVQLTGEAFFSVKRNEKAPFVVNTDECEVEVLGTTFNVMAYKEFGRQEITLLSGKVIVHTEDADQEIKPGQSMILKDHHGRIAEVTSADASGWVENKFNFRNIPLSELMKRLENWYDVDITLENTTGREVSFTGTFKNEETIWQVLDAISVYTPITYKKTNLRKIKITVSANY